MGFAAGIDSFVNAFKQDGPSLKSRQIENRSFLNFYFPQGGDSPPAVFDLPFYENIHITESNQASIVRYKPVGRSGELYAHTGAKSRKLNIEFNITLPHIQFDAIAFGLDKFLSRALTETKEEQKEKFKEPGLIGPPTASQAGSGARYPMSVSEKVLLRVKNAVTRFFGFNAVDSFEAREIKPEPLGEGQMGPLPAEDFSLGVDNPAAKFDKLFSNLDAHAVIYFWVNMIRASVLSNSKNPLIGPPIVRLSHGVLYNNIPCVVTGYSIGIDDVAGYEVKTMMPRRLIITMALEENRMGDMGTFNPGTVVKMDNAAGWEAVLEHGTLDPGRVEGSLFDD